MEVTFASDVQVHFCCINWKITLQKVMIILVVPLKGGTHMSNFKHLTREERNIIEQRLICRESFKSIARELGKDPTTIAKEIKNHIQFRQMGCYGKMFNDCRHRFDCPVMHLCGNSRCRRYCRFCKSHICSSLCHDYQKEICSRLLKPPYVCNGCEAKPSCTLEKRIFSKRIYFTYNI